MICFSIILCWLFVVDICRLHGVVVFMGVRGIVGIGEMEVLNSNYC